MGSSEMRFGAKLAHTEKHIRDMTVANLQAWLGSREQMSEVELLKVWKGLFYCMWMADKPKVQNELSENLARLLHVCQRDVRYEFFRAFLVTMEREWGGIDSLRMDKFYYMIRRFFRELFSHCAELSWDDRTVERVARLLTGQQGGPLRVPEPEPELARPHTVAPADAAPDDERNASGHVPKAVKKGRRAAKIKANSGVCFKCGQKGHNYVDCKLGKTSATCGPARGWVAAPRGLTYHTIDVFWTELCAVTDGGTELPPSSWPLLDLLLAQTARTRDTRAPFRVRTAFLDPLLSEEPAEGQQAPFAARNPALVVHVATRLGELAKAKDTHTANRDLLYSQWEVFRSLATVLTAGAAGGGEEEEEEEEEEPEGAGSGVVAMEGGEEMEANVEDEEEEGKGAEEDEQDKEDKEEEAAEEEEEEEEEEVDPEVTIGRKRKGKNRAATAPRAKVAKPSPKTRAAKSAPKKKAQPVAVDTEAGPKTLRRSSRRKAK